MQKLTKNKKVLILLSIVALVSIGLAFIVSRPDPTQVNPIQSVQMVMRDTSRKDSLVKVQLELEAHFTDNGRYPSALRITNEGKTILIGNRKVNLEKESVSDPSTTKATISSTRYCYAFGDNDYIIGVLLETGEWYYRGNLSAECKTI